MAKYIEDAIGHKEDEKWKPIKGYENCYLISTFGRIITLARNGIPNTKIISGTKCGRYERIGLRKNGVRKHFSVHRLVADTFIPNPNNLPQVDHINGNCFDNRVVNLRWATAKENIRNPITFARYKQKMVERRDNESCKAVSQYSKDGILITTFQSIREAERITGIPHSNISAAAFNKRRKHGDHFATIRSAGGYLWKFL